MNIGILKQQTLLIILFFVVVFVLIATFIMAVGNSSELSKSRELSQHSDVVIEMIRETNYTYKEADLCGRLALNGINHCNTSDKRQFTFKTIDRLREAVSDSSVQVENVNHLFDAIQKRFSVQDRVKNEGLASNQVVLSVPQSTELIEVSVQVERSFNNLQVQEFFYLRYRHNELQKNEFSYNRSVYFVTIAAFVSVCLFGVFTYKVLTRTRRVDQKLPTSNNPNERIIRLKADEVVIKVSEVEELRSILRGAS